MARFRRLVWRRFLPAAVLVLLIAIRWADEKFGDEPPAPPARRAETQARSQPPASEGPTPEANLPGGDYEVERVVDGDTLILKAGHLRVRLQGIDTPETVKEDTPIQPWGPEASEFAKAFVADAGGRVEIEIDGERVDQYGRYLAFVWSGAKLLNEELVRAGLARVKLGYDYGQAKKDRLRLAQQKAQRAGVGLWSKEKRLSGVRELPRGQRSERRRAPQNERPPE